MTRILNVALVSLALSLPGAALAQDSAPQGAPSAPAPAASVSQGMTVTGKGGSAIGTIESVEADLATVNTGKTRVRIPTNAFLIQDGAAMIGMTRDEFLTATAGIAQPVEEVPLTGAEAREKLLVGLAVIGKNDEPIGRIETIEGDFATVATTSDKRVRVPLDSFGVTSDGAVVGVSRAEFEAIVEQGG